MGSGGGGGVHFLQIPIRFLPEILIKFANFLSIFSHLVFVQNFNSGHLPPSQNDGIPSYDFEELGIIHIAHTFSFLLEL